MLLSRRKMAAAGSDAIEQQDKGTVAARGEYFGPTISVSSVREYLERQPDVPPTLVPRVERCLRGGIRECHTLEELVKVDERLYTEK